MYPTVFGKAASYLFSIARNHSFLDANKRTAASAALLFLRINGKNFDYDSDEFVNFVLDVAQGFKDINQISKHLESLWKKEQISESFKKAKKIKK